MMQEGEVVQAGRNISICSLFCVPSDIEWTCQFHHKIKLHHNLVTPPIMLNSRQQRVVNMCIMYSYLKKSFINKMLYTDIYWIWQCFCISIFYTCKTELVRPTANSHCVKHLHYFYIYLSTVKISASVRFHIKNYLLTYLITSILGKSYKQYSSLKILDRRKSNFPEKLLFSSTIIPQIFYIL